AGAPDCMDRPISARCRTQLPPAGCAAGGSDRHTRGRYRPMTNPLNLNAPVDTLAMEFTRDFDAPVAALFRAHADPELVKQWLGPRDIEMTIEHWDFKTGGGYRYIHKADRGAFSFNGVFHT